MTGQTSEADYFRRRAEAEIALAKAGGASRAYAEADYKTVIVEHPDGTIEKIKLRRPRSAH